MATLTSTKIKNTYDALLKASDNDAIGSSAKQITDGLGNGTPLYISTTQIGIGVTPEATFDLHVYQNAKVGGNLTITGDLTVNGTTTTVGTDTLSVKDPLIVLANNNTSADSVDIGFYGKYAPSGTTLYAGLFRDTGDNKFKIFRDLEDEPTTTVNTSGTGYTVATLVGNVEGTLTGVIASTTTATTQSAGDNSTKVATTAYVDTSAGNYLPLAGGTMSGSIAMGGNNISGGGTATFSSFVGDLTGNADTATALETARTIQVSGDVAGSASFDGTGDINISTTIQQNSVALGTDTTGNYVATISGTTNEIEVSGSGSETAAVTIGLPDDVTITGELTVSGTGQSSFGGQVTVPATPSASTDAASKGYVDSKFQETDTLAEVLALGNTTGATKIEVDNTSSGIDFIDNAKARFGTDDDLEIYHNGTNAVIDNNTNNLVFNVAGKTIINSSSTDNELNLGHTTGNWFLKATNSNTLIIGSESNATNNITLDTSNSGSATFSGDVTVTGGDLTLGTDSIASNINAVGDVLGINVDSNTGGGAGANIQLKTAGTTQLTINSSSATFAGKVGIGGTTITDSNLLNLQGSSASVNIGVVFNDTNTSKIFGIQNGGSALKVFDYSASAERVRIDSSGRVGINQTSPSSFFSNASQLVIGDGSTSRGMTIYGSSAGDSQIFFADGVTGDQQYRGIFRYEHSSDAMVMFTSATEKMRIDSSGNVGIGGTPTHKLYVRNDVAASTDLDPTTIKLYNNSDGGSGIEFSNSVSGNSKISFGVESTGAGTDDTFLAFSTSANTTLGERMRITSGGNVGIGTDSPQRKLHLHEASSGNSLISFTNTTTGTSSTNGLLLGLDSSENFLISSYYSGTNIILKTQNSERMRITTGGNVGIGIDLPDAKLHVHSGTAHGEIRLTTATSSGYDATMSLIAGQSGGVSILNLGYNGDDNYTRIFRDGSGNLRFDNSNAERLRIDTSGNVGIGKTPSFLLDLKAGTLTEETVMKIQKGVTGDTGGHTCIIGLGTESSGWAKGGLAFERTGSYDRGKIHFLQENTGNTDTATLSDSVMTIDSSGNVGISTDSPSAPLDVQGTSALFMTRTSGGLATYIENDGGYPFLAMYQIGGGAKVLINTNGNSYFNGGNVGIGGITSPNAKLEIGSGQAKTVTSGVEWARFGTSNEASNYATLTCEVKGGATAADRKWIFQTIESGVANAGNIIFQPSGGSVGIGTDSPMTTLHVQQSNGSYPDDANNHLVVESSSHSYIGLGGGTSSDVGIHFGDSGSMNQGRIAYQNSDDSLNFSTFQNVRMKITSAGYVGIRETSPNSYLYVKGTSSVVAGRFWGEAGTVAPLELAQNSGGGFLAKFYSDTFSTVCGSISHSGSATAFNTSSDYRLKENVVEMTDALDRVSQLKPSRFNFIGHEEIVDGFLAHEVSGIVPEAITGTKDEVDDEGNPIYQGIDQSKLVPLLVGAIQELKAEIETLKAQIN